MASTMRIGNLQMDAPFFQAGLAGYSDAAMRMIARRHGAPYCVTEAMLDHFLINGGKGLEHAELMADDHPIAGQLMGSHPDEIAQGSRILVELGYDVIDINLACPVKKIKKKCRGGHLLSVPEEAIAILDAVKQAVGDDRPCTVKLRRGSDDSPEAEANFYRIFEGAMEVGFAGATVHCRTVQQKYIGPSRWAFLKQLVERYKPDLEHFNLNGSGDIWCAHDVKRMLDETGVHGVSIARGCIGNPWVFRQARAILAGDDEAGRRPPTIHQQRDVLYEHFQLSTQIHGEKKAGMMMRKFGIKFSRHHPEGEQVRMAFIKVKCLADWEAVLAAWYADDGPGVNVDDAIPEEATPAGCGM